MDMMDLMSMMRMTDMMVATQGIQHLSVESPRKAEGKLKQVYAQINHDLTLAAPFTLHASQPDLVAAVWSAERETMFHGIVPRGHKEAVVASVAVINECPYCVDAHTVMMQASDEGDAAKIVREQSGTVQDAKMQALVDWAKASRTPDANIILKPPFSAEEAPEIIGGALAFHYINRMVNIFVDGMMMPDMGFLNRMMRDMMSGTAIKAMMQRKIEPGASLKFLPEADLPEEFSWAENNDIIAKTFAGITATITSQAEEIVSEELFATVQAVYDSWHGEDMGMGRAWVNQAIANLDEKEAIVAKMMLLAGLASYQVTESDIQAFRQYYPDDAQIISVTAWGAWSAVRRISSWLRVEAVEKQAV